MRKTETKDTFYYLTLSYVRQVLHCPPFDVN